MFLKTVLIFASFTTINAGLVPAGGIGGIGDALPPVHEGSLFPHQVPVVSQPPPCYDSCQSEEKEKNEKGLGKELKKEQMYENDSPFADSEGKNKKRKKEKVSRKGMEMRGFPNHNMKSLLVNEFRPEDHAGKPEAKKENGRELGKEVNKRELYENDSFTDSKNEGENKKKKKEKVSRKGVENGEIPNHGMNSQVFNKFRPRDHPWKPEEINWEETGEGKVDNNTHKPGIGDVWIEGGKIPTPPGPPSPSGSGGGRNGSNEGKYSEKCDTSPSGVGFYIPYHSNTSDNVTKARAPKKYTKPIMFSVITALLIFVLGNGFL